MGVNGEILKCIISWKRLIVERNGWNLILAALGTAYAGWIFCFILWVYFGVIRCTFGKIPTLRFSELLLPQFSSNYSQTLLYVGNEGIYAITLFCDLRNFKKFYGILKMLLIQDHMGLEMSKCYSTMTWPGFHLISAKLHEALATMVE